MTPTKEWPRRMRRKTPRDPSAVCPLGCGKVWYANPPGASVTAHLPKCPNNPLIHENLHDN